MVPAGKEPHLLGSIAWTAAAKWSVQIFSWISSLIIARLLSPSDFGLLSMTTLFLGLIAILSDFGLSSAVINVPLVTRRQVRQLNTASLCLAIVTFGIAYGGRAQIAAFFRQQELLSVVPAMGLGLVFSGLKAVPNALLQKALRFKVAALIDLLQAALQTGLTLLLAWLGFRYWALVLGGLAGGALSTLLTVACEHPGFALPRYSEIRTLLAFGWKVFVSSVCWYGYSNADFAVAGRVLGRTALGTYSLAWTLAMMPIDKLTSLIMRVTPGYFAKHQDDRATLRRYVTGLTKWISLIVFPLAFGMTLIARDVVPLALGPKWVAAVAPLTLLCVYVPFASLMTIFPHVLNAMGRPSVGMWNSILKLLIMPPAFYLGSRWGPEGIAIAWLVTYPPLAALLFVPGIRALEMGLSEYARAIRPALIASAVMVGVVFLIRVSTLSGVSPILRVGSEIGAGAVAYAVLVLAIDPSVRTTVLCALRRRSARWPPAGHQTP
jgi:PST family polysaccharide transporter